MSGVKIQWPNGKKFAFTVFDDTDLSRPGNFEPVYELLAECGMRTTKSVWPLHCSDDVAISGASCEDRAYLDYVLSLQRRGFEIGYHCSSNVGKTRPEIKRALDRFKDLFGHDPLTMSNHADSSEAIYWGESRLSGPRRWVYNVLTRGRMKDRFLGHVPESAYFWGDLCKSRVRYVRNFITGDINTLKACPWMPYRDDARPWVGSWFASTEGPNLEPFVQSISEENQDRLEREGGACIMYTHFGAGFVGPDGKLDTRFERLIRRMAAKDGWFVPVSTLLDHLDSQHAGGTTTKAAHHRITDRQRARLESRWLWHKIRVGHTS